ncbi:hypothetical protein PUN28_019044 [Cardiocondyla obscurior]|uniref:Uncharacterized protein n=1 Tax=Cardiocondyla obscurior TaxID=286306 RepID=A0AAW2EEJ5_9HYME
MSFNDIKEEERRKSKCKLLLRRFHEIELLDNTHAHDSICTASSSRITISRRHSESPRPVFVVIYNDVTRRQSSFSVSRSSPLARFHFRCDTVDYTLAVRSSLIACSSPRKFLNTARIFPVEKIEKKKKKLQETFSF